MSDELQETRPLDLMAAGAIKAADRMRAAVDEASGHLMMVEQYLVKGDVAKAHEWLVKARFRLAEVSYR